MTTYTTLPTSGAFANNVNTYGQPVNGNFADNPVGYGLDKGWIITSSGFVFLMGIGLALMEIGSTRRKHSRFVWYKMLLNLTLVIWWWFIIGFAWAFGDPLGSMIGAERFYAGGKWNQQAANVGINFYTAQYAHFIWRAAQAFIATTIVSAILAERVTLKALALFNLAFNLIILPFVFAWTFGGGFLVDDIGLIDYAGSWVVFGNAAVAGFVGLLLMKERYNRYGHFPAAIPVIPVGMSNAQIPHEGLAPQPVYSLNAAAQGPYPASAMDHAAPSLTYVAPSQVPASAAFTAENIIRARKRQDEDEYEYMGTTNHGYVCLGAFLTFIGFIFWNGGQTNGLQTARLFSFAEIAAVIAVLAAGGAGLVSFLFVGIFCRKAPMRDNAAFVARAMVAGMVATAASAHTYLPWVGLVTGMLGALAYAIMARVIYRLQLDDPAEFIAIFGGAGFAGLIIAAFFNAFNGIFYDNSTTGEILIYQILSFAIMAGWTFIIAGISWFIMRALKGLRVGIKNEVVGYDYIDGARHLDYPDQSSVFDLNKLQKTA